MAKKIVEIIRQDPAILAVNKPAGAITAHGRGRSDDLLDRLRNSGEQYRSLRLVHRLDRDTSGVWLLARTVHAQRSIVRQFQDRTVQKLYLALVAGYVVDDEGVVDRPIRRRRGNRRLMAVDRRHGKPARTLWRVLARYRGAALLLCKPLSGRTHQLRVHMQAMGHPLLVDPLYGGADSLLLSAFKANYRRKPGSPERPLIARCSLHALQLDLVHPDTGEFLRLQAPLPKDFRAAIHQLNRYASTGVPFDLRSFPQWSPEDRHPTAAAAAAQPHCWS